MDSDAWWTNVWWMSDVLASESLLTQTIHADHQTMLRKHRLVDRRRVPTEHQDWTDANTKITKL